MNDLSLRIDADIVARRIIPAVQGIRTLLNCGIPEALDELSKRYERLRAETPEAFTIGPDRYWDGFYS